MKLVAVSTAVTRAPGTEAPLASKTVPTIAPVSFCANNIALAQRIKAAMRMHMGEL
jgi:hypothetical protein